MKREEKFKRLVSSLRLKLGKEDFDARLLRRERRGIRPKLIRILAEMQVRMDGTKNHGRPHLHCSIGHLKHAASVAIDDGTVLAGKLTKLQERVIRDWVVRNRLSLINLWKTFQAGKPVDALIQEFKLQRF
jgi:hypothetical protein